MKFFLLFFFLLIGSCQNKTNSSVKIFYDKLEKNADEYLLEEYKKLPKDSNSHAFHKFFFNHNDTNGMKLVLIFFDSLGIEHDPYVRIDILNRIFYNRMNHQHISVLDAYKEITQKRILEKPARAIGN
jgi:hypothetical protein